MVGVDIGTEGGEQVGGRNLRGGEIDVAVPTLAQGRGVDHRRRAAAVAVLGPHHRLEAATARSAIGISGSARRRDVDRLAGSDQVADRVVDVPHVDVHPGDHPPFRQPEGDELAGAEIAADHDHLDPEGEAAVLHADVVLVGEEVRDLVVARRPGRASTAPQPGPG